jgi:hypothetical protein
MDNITQFGRVCQLIVGKDGSGIKISELRMRFDIKKSSDENPNTAKIEIYNLNPEHQNQLLKEWADIQLLAGYQGAERLIFSGQIRTATPKIQGTDRIITIESGDGDREILRGFVNKTLTKGCTANQVVAACQSSMFGVPNAHKDDLETVYARGRVLSGRASDVLTKQTKQDGAQWSIQDGQMLLLKGDNVRPNAVWLINQSTGMLGSPEPTQDGVKVKTLLNPAYLIGGVAKIDSEIYQGGVRIESIRHSGDTHSSEWSSELEGLRV